MPFVKGQEGLGRPKGTINKATIEVRDAARALVQDPDYRVSLIERLKKGAAPHMETLLWHYAYGKPKETVELHGKDGGPIEFAQATTVELLDRYKLLVEAAPAMLAAVNGDDEHHTS